MVDPEYAVKTTDIEQQKLINSNPQKFLNRKINKNQKNVYNTVVKEKKPKNFDKEVKHVAYK